MSELIDLIQALVQIESMNPNLVAEGSGEAEVAQFVAEWAIRNGLEAKLQETVTGRPNAIVRTKGTGRGKSLMLNGHLDTVGIEGVDQPFNPHIENGRMYGRGTYDMKASIAACLIVAKRAKQLNLTGDVLGECCGR